MRRYNKNGFTLIEVIVALAILSIGIVALLGAHRIALSHQQKAMEKKWALALAQEKLEGITAFKGEYPNQGEAKRGEKIFHWTSQRRLLQPGFSEWSVAVVWNHPKIEQVELMTWLRDFKNEK